MACCYGGIQILCSHLCSWIGQEVGELTRWICRIAILLIVIGLAVYTFFAALQDQVSAQLAALNPTTSMFRKQLVLSSNATESG
jgi:hypothetical protein